MSVTVEVTGGGTIAEVDVVLHPAVQVELVGGIPGPPGPPGPAGDGVLAWTHVQAVPAELWIITHPLGYQPNVTVIDSSNEQVEGDVVFGPVGTVNIIFSAAFSGTAYLS